MMIRTKWTTGRSCCCCCCSSSSSSSRSRGSIRSSSEVVRTTTTTTNNNNNNLATNCCCDCTKNTTTHAALASMMTRRRKGLCEFRGGGGGATATAVRRRTKTIRRRRLTRRRSSSIAAGAGSGRGDGGGGGPFGGCSGGGRGGYQPSRLSSSHHHSRRSTTKLPKLPRSLVVHLLFLVFTIVFSSSMMMSSSTSSSSSRSSSVVVVTAATAVVDESYSSESTERLLGVPVEKDTDDDEKGGSVQVQAFDFDEFVAQSQHQLQLLQQGGRRKTQILGDGPFPFCNVCALVDNGNGFVTINESLSGIGGITMCQEAQLEGQRGNISPTDCTGIQTEINISDRCGCLAKGTGPNPAPSPSTPTGPTDPTNVPTLFPTRVPTPFPTTISPSSQPSLQPSTNPSTSRPSTNPSTQPSLPQPSVSPTMVESAMPSVDERQFCNICRDGGSVGNGLAVIASVSNSTPPLFFTCDQVDALARNSAFTQDECFIFQALASAQDQCGCVGGPTPPPSTPTTAPAALIPTLAPSTVPPTPNNPCNICGPGGAVKFLDNVIGSMTCLETQDMGLSGAFDSTTCIIYQGTASLIPPDICGCLGPTNAPSEMPSLSIEPSTSPPSLMPSQSPSTIPSFVPSVTPSTLPSLQPSETPSRFPSQTPSFVPTNVPSESPSNEPSMSPSESPSTSFPSLEPSFAPSECPLNVEYFYELLQSNGWTIQLWRRDQANPNYVLVSEDIAIASEVEIFCIQPQGTNEQYIIQLVNENGLSSPTPGRLGPIPPAPAGNENLQFLFSATEPAMGTKTGIALTNDVTSYPNNAFDFTTYPDIGDGAVCQAGFDVPTGTFFCGSCRYTSFVQEPNDDNEIVVPAQDPDDLSFFTPCDYPLPIGGPVPSPSPTPCFFEVNFRYDFDNPAGWQLQLLRDGGTGLFNVVETSPVDASGTDDVQTCLSDPVADEVFRLEVTSPTGIIGNSPDPNLNQYTVGVARPMVGSQSAATFFPETGTSGDFDFMTNPDVGLGARCYYEFTINGLNCGQCEYTTTGGGGTIVVQAQDLPLSMGTLLPTCP